MAQSRTIKNALFRLLEQASQPIYLVDHDRKIVFCNARAAAWLGCSVEEATELKCHYHSSDQVSIEEQMGAGLCPPPECFDGEPRKGWIATMTEGRPGPFRHSYFHPLQDERGQTQAVLVVADRDEVKIPASELPQDTRDTDYLHAAIRQMRSEAQRRFQLDRLVGTSSYARQIRRQVEAAIGGGIDTLIVGPQGSGREHLAKSIHYAESPDRAGALMPIDCALSDQEIIQNTIKDLYRRRSSEPDKPLGRLLLLEVDLLPHPSQIELLEFRAFGLPVDDDRKR